MMKKAPATAIRNKKIKLFYKSIGFIRRCKTLHAFISKLEFMDVIHFSSERLIYDITVVLSLESGVLSNLVRYLMEVTPQLAQ